MPKILAGRAKGNGALFLQSGLGGAGCDFPGDLPNSGVPFPKWDEMGAFYIYK